MSWQELDLSGVSTDMELIPEGEFVFSLLNGAKYSQWNPNKIEAAAKVDEGEYKGRVTYFSYGDPEKVPAMAGALKRLERAIFKNTGAEIASGQDPVEFLNDNAGAKFIGTVYHREFENKDGEKQRKAEIKVFKVKPVPSAA